MRSIIFVIDSESGSAEDDEMEAIDKFNQELAQNKQLLMAAGIVSSSKAQLIDNREGLGSTTQGSLNGREFYSGFWIVETASQEQAQQLALGGSKACNRRVELRHFL